MNKIFIGAVLGASTMGLTMLPCGALPAASEATISAGTRPFAAEQIECANKAAGQFKGRCARWSALLRRGLFRHGRPARSHGVTRDRN